MATEEIRVPGPIVLVYSSRFVDDVDRRLTPFLQEADGLARQGLLPITVEQTAKGGWRAALYAARYVAWLYPTSGGDAYQLGHAARRQFRDEERLLQRALLLCCPGGFRPFPDLATVNMERRSGRLPATSVYGDRLWQAWHALRPAPAGRPPEEAAHARYLDQLGLVVEAAQQIETRRYAAMPPHHYVSRSATAEQRYSARAVYRFRIAGGEPPAVNTMVSLGDPPRMRGKVIRAEGSDVTVRFEPGADYRSIGAQGVLRPLPSDRVFRAQREAIAQLRAGRSVNPRLAATLASARYLPYEPEAGARPVADLDPSQCEAFQRALAVPDVLTVLGPPGAGKTTTIIEVVRAAVARGQRVLITSHTHRAVDNVLENLPPDLAVVRIGSEDNISGRIRALSSENRVESVRREILDDTGLLDALSRVRAQRPMLDRYLARLGSLVEQAASAQTELDRLGPALAAAVEQASGPLRAEAAAAEHAAAYHRSTVAARSSAVEQAERRARTSRARIDEGAMFAAARGWLLRRRLARLHRLRTEAEAAVAAARAAEAALAEVRVRAERAADGDPGVALLRADRERAAGALADLWSDLDRAGDFLAAALRPVAAVPPLPGPSVAGWAEFHQGFGTALTLVDRRAAILAEWRERIGDLSIELEREVARYAQVVGATCIGTDTSALISDLEFDLAIVDEAGQISTPNLLVPLVRSRRAVLVGDHHQLPPFLDEEVRDWAEATGGTDAAVAPLVTRSGFELLFRAAPRANAVLLRTQRRMPPEIADFVSAAFYAGQVRTDHRGGPPDAVFRSPFAMVDTADRPPAQRRETAMAGRGESIRYGYRNDLEATAIVDLVTALSPHYRDWAVIVPFNAQKELVSRRLAAALGGAADVSGNVGSVDSFQGGERDLIVFGFTRSNPRGDIGFLRELRRLNVAVTRARRQLVLVGDLSTLLAARDEGFRNLMRELSGHLDRAGDRRPSAEVTAALAALREHA